MRQLKCAFLLFICYSIFIGSGFAQNSNKRDSLNQALENAGNDSVKVEVMLQLATLFRSEDYKKSLEYSLSAMEMAELLQNDRLLSKVVVNSGQSFLWKGLFDQAVKFFKRQLELGQKLGDENIIGRAYFNLGLVRLVLEDYSLALEYLSNSLRYINSYNEKENKKLSLSEKSTINNAFGVAYTGLKDFNQAESYFLLGIRDTKGVPGEEHSYCQMGNNYADLLLKNNEWTKAKDILTEILPIQEKTQNKPGVIGALLSLGKVEEATGNFDLAKSYFNRGLALSYSINGFSPKKHLTAALSQLFDKISKPDSALYYLNLSLAFEDSLNIQKAKEELLKNELELQFQEVKSDLEKAHETDTQKYVYGILISLVGLGALVFLYWRTKRRFHQTQSQHSDLLDVHQAVVKTNVKLTEEISLKKQELTLNEMRNTKSKELIAEIATKIKDSSGEGRSPELKKLIAELKSSYKDKSWSEVEHRFKQIHGNFYEVLTERYPDLTLNERKLSAFLKLQMTTKEISALTGQSPRSIELARTRLRKKLGLTNSDQNLYDFFLGF